MASEDLSTLQSLPSADDEKYGFKRPEMNSSNLAGTVDAYDRHVFLCYKSPEDWTAKIEDSDTDLLPKLLSAAVKARKNDITIKTKLTVCEGREGTEYSNGDVLIFPDMVKYRGLTESDADSFVDDVFVKGQTWDSVVAEALTGSYVFVCAHGSRDKRCGVCGPPLIEKLNEEIALRGLNVTVSPCSHVGGHKYAGNLIIYSPGSDGKITGHWYGYVTPEDVPELLDQHIGKGETIERLWRGQMGVYSEEGKKSKEHKQPNGEGAKKSTKKPEENEFQSIKENVDNCCQGVNGISCCRDPIAEKTNGIEEKKVKAADVHGKPGLTKFSLFNGTLEKSDILAGIAVIGAAATVCVAYSLYRRSH